MSKVFRGIIYHLNSLRNQPAKRCMLILLLLLLCGIVGHTRAANTHITKARKLKSNNASLNGTFRSLTRI